MAKYKAVLFDMDGVIVDSMKYHALAWRKVFRKFYGIELSTIDIYKREGMSGLSSIIDILREKGANVPEDKELEKLREEKLKIFEKNQIKLFPLVHDIMKFLKLKEVKMGLVTGSLRRSVSFMLPADILKFFDVIVAVDDIKNGKPHPEPYNKGIEGFRISSDEILAIENAPMGILSAKNAGLTCFAIETTLPEEYLKNSDIIFRNHDEFFKYLKEIF